MDQLCEPKQFGESITSENEENNNSTESCIYDTDNVMEKMEECNKYTLELFDMQQILANNDINVVSNKLLEVQGKLYGAICSAERIEAMRQESEFQLACSSRKNNELLDVCSKQCGMLQAEKAKLEETKRYYENLLSTTVNRWEDLQLQWHQEKTALENSLKSQKEVLEKIQSELNERQSQLTSAKNENKDIREELNHIRKKLQSERNLKSKIEERYGKTCNDLLKEKRYLHAKLKDCEQKLEGALPKDDIASWMRTFLVGSLKTCELQLRPYFVKWCHRIKQLDDNLLTQLNRINQFSRPDVKLKVSSGLVKKENEQMNSTKEVLTIPTVNAAGHRTEIANDSDNSSQGKGDDLLLSDGQNLSHTYGKRIYDQLAEIAKLLDQQAVNKTDQTAGQNMNANELQTSTSQMTMNKPMFSQLRRTRSLVRDKHNLDYHECTKDVRQLVGELLAKAMQDLAGYLKQRNQADLSSPTELRDVQSLLTENKVLRERLTHMRLKLKRAWSENRELSHTKDRLIVRDHNHTNTVELATGFEKAVEEIDRWQRRWKHQQLALQLERQRVKALRETQQTDQKLKKKFLDSVCQLVQEASRQIDRAIYKHIKQLSATASTPIEPTDSHPEKPLNVASNKCLHDSRTKESKRPSPQSRQTHAHPQSSGDNPWESVETVEQSKAEPTPVQQRFRNELFLHTNCNNNVGFDLESVSLSSQLNDQSFYANTAETSVISGGYFWSDNTNETGELTVNRGPVQHDSFDDLADCCSSIQSVATTSDPLQSESPKSFDTDWIKDYAHGDANTDDAVGENARANMVEETHDGGEYSTDQAARSFSRQADPALLELESSRWLQFRSSVRFELSRVLDSVVNHAKQDDSLAQECLDAILDIQKRLLRPFEETLNKSQEDVIRSHCHDLICTPPLVAPEGEDKHRNARSCRHLSNAVCMARRESTINKGLPSHMASIQVSVPILASTPPLSSVSTEPVRATTLATAHNINETTERAPPSEPVVKSSATKSVQPAFKRTSYLKREEDGCPQKAKWKPVGGVIHPPVNRDPPPVVLHQKSASTRRTSDQVQKSSHSNSSILPSITNRRILSSNGTKKKSSSDPASEGEHSTKQAKVGSSATVNNDAPSSTSCILPPLTSQQTLSGDNTKRKHSCVGRSQSTHISIARDSQEVANVDPPPHIIGQRNPGARYRMFNSILRRTFDEPDNKLGSIQRTLLRGQYATKSSTLQEVKRKCVVSEAEKNQANVNNTSPTAPKPRSIQWLEVEGYQGDGAAENELDETRVIQTNRCCCGSSCCRLDLNNQTK